MPVEQNIWRLECPQGICLTWTKDLVYDLMRPNFWLIQGITKNKILNNFQVN